MSVPAAATDSRASRAEMYVLAIGFGANARFEGRTVWVAEGMAPGIAFEILWDTLNVADLRERPMSDTHKRSQISLRTPNEDIAAFDKIALVLQRDRTWVMLRAFRLYLEGEGSDLLRDAEGLASLDRGEGQDFDVAMDELESIVAEAALREAS